MNPYRTPGKREDEEHVSILRNEKHSDVLIIGVALIGAISGLFPGIIVACSPASARPAAYGLELEECNRTANTLEESVACENQVRARYGRPMRVIQVEPIPAFSPKLPASPVDAGGASQLSSPRDAGME